MPKGHGYDTPPEKAAAFKLKSGNSTPFKMMGSSPVKQEKEKERKDLSTATLLAKKWAEYQATLPDDHPDKGKPVPPQKSENP